MTSNSTKRGLVLLTIPSLAALAFLPLAGCSVEEDPAAQTGAEDGVAHVDPDKLGAPTNVVPWEPEVCDGVDNDWDDEVDEEDPSLGLPCVTGQPGICSPGTLTCLYASIQCVPDTAPQAEDCNTPADEDCDGFSGCPGGGHVWSKQFSGTGHTAGTGLVLDPAGNIIVGADFGGPVDFGAGPVTATSWHEGVLMKRDPSGNLLWLRQFGATNGSRVASVGTDAAGNIYAAGNFGGTIDLGLGPATSIYPSYGNFYLVKLDANGNTLWQRTFDHSGEQPIVVIPDHAGNVYLSGSFWATVDFGTGPVKMKQGIDGFVVKIDGNGNTLWTRIFSGVNEQSAIVTAVDAANNPLVSIRFSGDIDMGSGPIPAGNGYDAILAKLDTSGNLLWSRHYGGNGMQSVAVTSVAPNGDLIAAAWFDGQIDLGGGALTADRYDAAVARLDASGNFLWQKHLGGPGDQNASVRLDGAGNWIVYGSFSGFLDYGAGLVPAASTGAVWTVYDSGPADAFVLKLNGSGAPVWFHRYGDTTYDYVTNGAVDAAGNFVFTGGHGGSINFGGSTFTAVDLAYDMFLAKIAP